MKVIISLGYEAQEKHAFKLEKEKRGNLISNRIR